MPVTPQQILDIVADYLAVYPGDEAALAPVTAVLRSGSDLTSRKEFRGHVTASAVLVNPAGRVLLVRHRALGLWLRPGGHLEEGDSDFTAAALRELEEETGVSASDVELVSAVPLHVDVHHIPANAAKNEAEHQHFDFRMLFRTGAEAQLRPQAEEVTGAAWCDFAEITDDVLRARIVSVFGGRERPSTVSAR